MTEVHWLEQTETDVSATNGWLSQTEAARLDSLRFAKRRRDWRLGRWTAKLATAAYRNLSADFQTLRDIEVRPASTGAPEVFLAGQPADITISLTHRDGIAMCAVAPSSVALGCDLELIEPRSHSFVQDYFTGEEREFIARTCADDQSCVLTLLWSGKESALKALRTGLRLDTRSVVVSLDEVEQNRAEGRESHAVDGNLTPIQGATRWLPLHIRCTSGQTFHGWWQSTQGFVQTLVATPPPFPPIQLKPVPWHSV